MKLLLLCFLNTCLMATGQLLFKAGASGKNINSVLDMIQLFFTPLVFCALCLYAAATGLWLYILSRMPISQAYPIQALAFPLVLLASIIFFHEQISVTKWIGIAVIVCGVYIAARG